MSRSLVKLFLLVLLVSLKSTGTMIAPTPVIWSDQRIVAEMLPGLTLTQHVQFTAGVNESNIVVYVVPELSPFVNVQPNHFDAIALGRLYDVAVRMTIPFALVTPSLFQGTIHLKIGNRTLARPLEVDLIIEGAAARQLTAQNIVADPSGDQYARNEIVITLRSGTSLMDAQRVASSIGGSVVGAIPSINTYQIEVSVSTGQQLDSLLAGLRTNYATMVTAATRHYVLSRPSIVTDLAQLRAYDSRLTAAYDKVRIEGAWQLIAESQKGCN